MPSIANATTSPVFSSRDLDETRQHLSGALGRKIELQPLGEGQFEASIAARMAGPLRIISASYAQKLEWRSNDTIDNISVSIVGRGGLIQYGRRAAMELSAGDAGIYNTATLTRSILQPGLENCFLSWTKAEVETFLEKLFDRRIALPTDIGLTRLHDQATVRSIAALASLVEQTVTADADCAEYPHFRRLLLDAMLMRIVEAIPSHRQWFDARPARPASWQIRQALDFIQAQPHPVSVNDVADVAGIGVRALQLAFQDQLGTTPHAYLKRVRLEAVRSALGKSDLAAPIGEIARRWGFSNATRFATEYAAAFGSKPSQAKSIGRMTRGRR